MTTLGIMSIIGIMIALLVIASAYFFSEGEAKGYNNGYEHGYWDGFTDGEEGTALHRYKEEEA